jgi:hypothetical protein
MHENFLSYIMIGLSRGLFPSATTQPPRHFDEEAYLRRQAALRLERQRETARLQRSKPAEPQSIRTETGSEVPAGQRRVAFWWRGMKIDQGRAHLAGKQTCRAA